MSQAQVVDVPESDPRVKQMLKVIKNYQKRPDALVQVLHAVQDTFGYLPMNLIRVVSKELHIPPSRVFGVVTFYYYFSLKPKGEHNCLVCTGTACYVKGAQKIIDQISASFGVKDGQTTPDNKLGLQTARCIGCCGLAPAVVLDNEILPRTDPAQITGLINARLGAKK